jgi:hypothetical protein
MILSKSSVEARYEKESPGAGMPDVARVCLPEILPPEELRARPFGTQEFDELTQRLRSVPKDKAA